MKISDLLDDVTNQDVSLWEVGEYSIQIKDSFKESFKVVSVVVDKDAKVLVIKISK